MSRKRKESPEEEPMSIEKESKPLAQRYEENEQQFAARCSEPIDMDALLRENDEDDDTCTIFEEYEVNREACIEEYRRSIHGVDIALPCEEPGCPRTISMEFANSFLDALQIPCEGPILVNFFFDERNFDAHMLVVSTLTELQILRALSDRGLLFSLAPAFLTTEEEVAEDMFFYLSSVKRDATTLTIF